MLAQETDFREVTEGLAISSVISIMDVNHYFIIEAYVKMLIIFI